jgi:chemotaxis protein histidine kinase CheA
MEMVDIKMNDEDLEFLKTLQLEFIGETTDSLLLCEDCLIKYEKQKSPELLQKYLRILHSIKGSARAVEFEKIAMTVHKVEGLGSKPDSEIFVELSLKSIDTLREAIEYIRSGEIDQMNDILDEIMATIP